MLMWIGILFDNCYDSGFPNFLIFFVVNRPMRYLYSKILTLLLLPLWLIIALNNSSFAFTKTDCRFAKKSFITAYEFDVEKESKSADHQNNNVGICVSLSYCISNTSNYELVAYWQNIETTLTYHTSYYTSIYGENDPDPPKRFF